MNQFAFVYRQLDLLLAGLEVEVTLDAMTALLLDRAERAGMDIDDLLDALNERWTRSHVLPGPPTVM